MNPSENSIEESSEYLEMVGIEVHEMEKVTDEDGSFWACPMCKKDDYLMDIESLDEVALRGV